MMPGVHDTRYTFHTIERLTPGLTAPDPARRVLDVPRFAFSILIEPMTAQLIRQETVLVDEHATGPQITIYPHSANITLAHYT